MFILLLACLLITLSNAMYFHVKEGQRPNCFIEEVPDLTHVTGYYENPDQEDRNKKFPDQPQHLNIKVTDPDGSVVYQGKALDTGDFKFTSHSGGEYVICIVPDRQYYAPHSSGIPLRFHLHLETADKAINYEEVAKKEQLGELEIAVLKLNDKIMAIQKEQQYQRERAEAFRSTSESTNGRVAYLSIFQAIVLLGSGAWQVFQLKSFFIKKKLV